MASEVVPSPPRGFLIARRFVSVLVPTIVPVAVPVIVLVPVLVLVIVLVLYSVLCRVFADLSCSFRHSGQHRHDAMQNPLSVGRLVAGRRPTDDENICARGALQRRSARNLEEPSSIRHGTLSVSFGDVLRNRLRRAQELVPRVAMGSGEFFGPLESPGDELERDPVDVELLVVECHAAPITSTSTSTSTNKSTSTSTS